MREEICQYFKRGNCRLQSGTEAVSVNTTMLNPTSLKWELDPALCPFDGYLPMSWKSWSRPFKKQSCSALVKQSSRTSSRLINDARNQSKFISTCKTPWSTVTPKLSPNLMWWNAPSSLITSGYATWSPHAVEYWPTMQKPFCVLKHSIGWIMIFPCKSMLKNRFAALCP